MNNRLYHLVARGLDELVWGGDLIGGENLPEHGPAVFVSNHLGALGPIAVGASVPLRFHFWIHADLLDARLAPDYLRRDFVERQLHLLGPASGWLAAIISRIHVPLLGALGGIPVHHTPGGRLKTFQLSLDVLEARENILIFPENPELPLDERYKMAPFKKGFTRLGEMYHERTKQILSFYPLAVHAESLTVRLGKPIRYNPMSNPTSERVRIVNLLERTVRAMYLQASNGNLVQLPLPN